MPRFFNPQSITKQGFRISAAYAGSATLFLFVMAIMASPAAEAQVVRHTTVTPRPGVSHSRTVIVDRGPFTPQGYQALMRAHGVTHVVAKNAGGTGASAKLAAARALGLPVVMVDRPAVPARATAASVAEVMDWLHRTPPRGV